MEFDYQEQAQFSSLEFCCYQDWLASIISREEDLQQVSQAVGKLTNTLYIGGTTIGN